MSNTTTATPTPAPSLSDRDIVIIASTAGAIAGLIAFIIIVLLLCQKCYRKKPHPDDERHMISHFGSTQNSFLTQDYNPQTNHLYDNNANRPNHMEFRERPPLAPQRSRSFQERRDYVEPEYHSKGYYDSHIRRSGSAVDLGQMRMWDNKFPDSRYMDLEARDPTRRLPDNMAPEYQVATLPSGNRMPTYHVPRPAIGGRFEPLWKGSLYM